MGKPELKVIRVPMKEGEHEAVAVLHQFEGGKVTISTIEWRGPRPLADDDNSYEDVPAATAAAKKIWLAKLQG